MGYQCCSCRRQTGQKEAHLLPVWSKRTSISWETRATLWSFGTVLSSGSGWSELSLEAQEVTEVTCYPTAEVQCVESWCWKAVLFFVCFLRSLLKVHILLTEASTSIVCDITSLFNIQRYTFIFQTCRNHREFSLCILTDMLAVFLHHEP